MHVKEAPILVEEDPIMAPKGALVHLEIQRTNRPLPSTVFSSGISGSPLSPYLKVFLNNVTLYGIDWIEALQNLSNSPRFPVSHPLLVDPDPRVFYIHMQVTLGYPPYMVCKE